MTTNQITEILYLYIVEGYSMEEVGYRTNWTTAEVSQTVRDFGFNNDGGERKGWQSGKDRGRYKRGSKAARGIAINRNIIREFVDYGDDWDWDFEYYIDCIYEEQAEQRREQQRQQQANYQAQQQRQRQYEEDMARRQREEQQRQQQMEADRRRREEEEKKQQEQNKTNYNIYCNAGKKALKEGDLQTALNNFYNARNCTDTYELYALIAETYAKSGNANTHAYEIIKELSVYKQLLDKNNQKFSFDQYLWLARAYAQTNQTDNAANHYCAAADIAYYKKDYILADSIYKENIEKTNKYDGRIVDYAFKVAFCRSKIPNMTVQDHEFCIKYYERAIEKGEQEEYAYGNVSWHYLKTYDYFEAIYAAKMAIDYGNREKYVYNNLLNAYIENGDYDDALELMEKMDDNGYSYEPYLKGECIYNGYSILDDEEKELEAKKYFKQQYDKNPTHIRSLYMLTILEKDDIKSIEYGLKYLSCVPYENVKNDEIAKMEYELIADVTFDKAKYSKIQTYIDRAGAYNPGKKAEYDEELRRQEMARKNAEAERIEREKRAGQARTLEEQRKREEEDLLRMLF